jgi:hypothetical protein
MFNRISGKIIEREYPHTRETDCYVDFSTLLYRPSASKPTKLSSRLGNVAAAWIERAETFQTTLKPYCSSLLQKVVSEPSNREVWMAVVRLRVLEKYDPREEIC